jgi:hypothetical protein
MYRLNKVRKPTARSWVTSLAGLVVFVCLGLNALGT